MKKYREYNLTENHLENYMKSSLTNSKQLIDEARLLASNRHYARAYFLAIASIEESGKAHTAFEAKGRNLNNPGICKNIKAKFENHSNKITSGFAAWIQASSSPREAIEASIELIVDLKYGREKSMYVDVIEDTNKISSPDNQIRPKAANDSIEIAINCLHHTEKYIKSNIPTTKTSFQDKFFCINQNTLTKMMNNRDFWEFYLSELGSGKMTLEKAAVTYHDNYYKKVKYFLPESS